MRARCLITWAGVWAGWHLAFDARAAEKHYLLIFGSQSEPTRMCYSHTFATFVKATYQGDDPALAKLETVTISWLPATMSIHTRLRREPGRNFDLPTTLDWAKRLNACVRVWGPYEIEPELYEHARRRAAWLDSGAVAYRMLDVSLRKDLVTNCIHAVCDLVPGEPCITGIAYGHPASARAVQHFRRWMRNPDCTHDWLIDRLKLGDYGVQRR